MTTTEESSYRLPNSTLWEHVAKIAIVEDRPIMLDYWVDSLDKKALIGVRENGEKLLVKNSEEYTSPISKIYKVADSYFICTENSFYLAHSDIPTKRIS